MKTKLIATAVVGALLAAAVASPASAQRYHRHHHRGGGGAFIGGLAAGALIGGAFAAQPRYGYGYGPGPGYYAVPVDDGAVQYCLSRFKSYDPASGTYLGYDGARHPCP